MQKSDRIIKIVTREPADGIPRAHYWSKFETFTRFRDDARHYGDYREARADMTVDAHKLKQPGRIVRCVYAYSSDRELPDGRGFRHIYPKMRRK